MTCGLAALDAARHLDRAAEQQQLLGQRGLAGVRMRDDGERAPALCFFGLVHGELANKTPIIRSTALHRARFMYEEPSAVNRAPTGLASRPRPCPPPA